MKGGAEPRVTRRQAFALVAGSLLFCFLLLELGARLYSWHLGKGFWTRPHSFDSPFFVTYDPPMPSFEGKEAVFRHDLRLPIAKPAGELRVICLGGSTTVNVAVPPGQNYPALAEKGLRARLPGRSVRVLEAGGDAFATAHSVVNLALRLAALEPDVVTLLHNVNDLTAQHFGDRVTPDYANKYLDDAFLAYEHRGGLGGAVLRGSRALQMLKWRVSLIKAAFESSSRRGQVDNPEDGRAAFRRNLLSFVALARAHGATPILITQSHRAGEAAAFSGEFLAYNELVRQVAGETVTPLVDAAPELSGRPEFFVDDVHMNAAGLAALAARVEPAVAAALAARGAS